MNSPLVEPGLVGTTEADGVAAGVEMVPGVGLTL